MAHVHVQAPVEGKADTSGQQAGHNPAEVKTRAGRTGGEIAAPCAEGNGGQAGDGNEQPQSHIGEHGLDGAVRKRDGGHCHRSPDGRTQSDVQNGGVGKHDAGITPDCSGRQTRQKSYGLRAVAPAQSGIQHRMQRPAYDSGHDSGEYGVNVNAVNVGAAAQRSGSAKIKDAIGSQGRRRAVVEIEEPDRAVHEGEAHGEQRVHRADGDAVEGELQGLGRRLADFPGQIGNHRCSQDNGQHTSAGHIQQLG